MTDNEFTERLAAMRETMYRVSYSQLSQGCDRDDAVQETLLKAWDRRRKLKDERFMQTWIIHILINECHNIQRKGKRVDLMYELPERVAPAEANEELHDALFHLDEKLRLPIVLHYIEGFRTNEIAEILSVPQGTVTWRISKARKELNKMLGGRIGGRDDKLISCEEDDKPCLKMI